MAGNEELGTFLAKLIAGTAEVGFATMPILAAYKQARTQEDWKEAGFAEWLKTDPKAPQLLERALTSVKDAIPYEQRAALIIALGGLPQE